MRPQKIVVLGGTGFVGRHLVPRLQRDGHAIRVLTRNRDGGVPGPANDLVDRVERDERGHLDRAAMGRGCSPTEGCHAHGAKIGPPARSPQCGYPYSELRPSGVF